MKKIEVIRIPPKGLTLHHDDKVISFNSIKTIELDSDGDEYDCITHYALIESEIIKRIKKD